MATSNQLPDPVDLPPVIAEPLPDPKEQWDEERRHFVGGSEIYELLNEPQYGQGCVRALAYKKLNFPPDYPEQMDDPVRARLFKRGHIMEPIAAALYAEETGRKLRCPPTDANGLPKARLHPEFPWAGVHYDRLVLAGSGNGDMMVTETGTAEIKSRGKGPYLQMLKSGCFPGDVLQTQHGMFVNRHNWGTFIAVGLFDSRGDEDGMGALPLKHFDMKRDEKTIDIIKDAGDRFASTVFVNKALPDRPFEATDDRCKVCAWRMECRGEELDKAAAAAFKAQKKGDKTLVQIVNADLSQELAARDFVKAQIDALDHEPTKSKPDPGPLQMAEARIKEMLGEVDAAYVEGYGKVLYGWTAGRTTFVDIGKAVEYLKDVTAPTAQAIHVLERLSFAPVDRAMEQLQVGEVLTILRNIADIPKVVTSQYVKSGEPYRTLRTYPAKM